MPSCNSARRAALSSAWKICWPFAASPAANSNGCAPTSRSRNRRRRKQSKIPRFASQALVGALAGAHRQRLLIGDGQAVGFERHELARMIGEHAQGLQAEVDQNLRADAAFMLEQALASDILIELPAPVIEHARHFAGTRGRLLQLEAASGVVQINEDAAILAHDGFERTGHRLIAIA